MDKTRQEGKSPRWVRALWIGLLGLAGFAAYSNSFRGDFVFDDLAAIAQNSALRGPLPLERFASASQRPLLYLSLWANYQCGELAPWGYHFLNVCLHVGCGILLYLVIQKTLANCSASTIKSPRGVAWTVALLWLVHPLQTESVTYTIQRGEVLIGLFTLLCLYGLISAASSSRATLWHAGVILAFALGMATKRAMVVAPLLVLMYDGMFLSPSWKDAFTRRKLLYLGFLPILVWGSWEPIALLRDSLAESGAISRPVLLSLPANSENASPAKPGSSAKIAIPAPTATGQRNIAGFGYQGISSWDFFRSQPAVLLHYLKLSLWPSELCIDYWWPVADGGFTNVLSLGLVLFALGASFYAYCHRRAWGFLGLAFFVHLAPRSSFIPRYDLAVEHRMYLPLACVLTLVVLGGERLLGKLARRAKWSPRACVCCSAAIVAVAALGLMARTINRNQDYDSAQAIWQNTVRVSPHNPRAHYNLAVALEADGDIPLACEHYRQSLAHAPDFMEAHANLGQWLIELGEINEGLKHLQRAAELAPEVALVQANYAARLLSLGRLAEAETFARRAAEMSPAEAAAWERLGTIVFRQGHLPEAAGHFQKALALDSHRLSASLQLADIQMQERDVASARRTYHEIVKSHPECPAARRGLANTFAASGKFAEAQPHYRAACRIAPEDVANHVDWGRACFLGKDYAEAVTHFTQALNIRPRDPELQIHLASALAECGRTVEAAAMYRRALPGLPPESPMAAPIQAWLTRQAAVPTKAGASRN